MSELRKKIFKIQNHVAILTLPLTEHKRTHTTQLYVTLKLQSLDSQTSSGFEYNFHPQLEPG